MEEAFRMSDRNTWLPTKDLSYEGCSRQQRHPTYCTVLFAPKVSEFERMKVQAGEK